MPAFLLNLTLAGFLLAGIAAAHDHSRPATNAKDGGPECAEDPDNLCRLRIELRDAESGTAIPGVIRLLDPDGTPVRIPELLDRCVGLPGDARKLGWHTLIKPAEVSAPRAAMTLEAFSGIETGLLTQALDLSGKTEHTASFKLKRFWNAADRGLVSGNTHLHLKDLTREEADRYLREVPRGDGLDILFVSFLERALVDRTYITNAHTRADLKALSNDDLIFGNGEEYRHNFGGGGEGYGHVMFLDLPERVLPASVGPGITKKGDDGTPLRPGILNARSQNATIVWCHNTFGTEDLPNWLAGLVHAQNIFDGGNRGSYEDAFYRYLDLGMHPPFSTGTDWFIYDFSRVYATTDPAKANVTDWLAALRKGRTFITNGPLLEFSVNESAGPGDEISLDGSGELSFTATAAGRHDFGRIEIIRDGKVAASSESRVKNGHFAAELTGRIEFSESGWLALRVDPSNKSTTEFGRPVFAHTSAVSVIVGGRPIFKKDTAREMIAEIEKNLASIEDQGSFKNADDRESVRLIYRGAIEELKSKLAD